MAKKKEESTPDVYKVSEVAKMLRVDARTVYGMIERKELPSLTVGRLVRIPASAVKAFIGGEPTTADAK